MFLQWISVVVLHITHMSTRFPIFTIEMKNRKQSCSGLNAWLYTGFGCFLSCCHSDVNHFETKTRLNVRLSRFSKLQEYKAYKPAQMLVYVLKYQKAPVNVDGIQGSNKCPSTTLKQLRASKYKGKHNMCWIA